MKALICLLLIGALTGCGSILSATRDTPIESNKGTRTIGSTIDDQLIETKAAVNIAKAHIDLEREARITVISYNGVVLLTGQVPRQDLKELAGSVTQRARNPDALITTSAKTRLLADSAIPGRRIKVTTEAGIVYLLGLVRRNEAELAVQAVQQVGGVQRIVKLFEYID